MVAHLTFLKTKPALKTVIPFIIGLIIGYHVEIDPVLMCLLLTILLITSLLLSRWRGSVANFLLLLALVAGGMLRYYVSTKVFPDNHIRRFLKDKGRTTIVGKVVGFPQHKKDRIEFEMEVDSLRMNQRREKSCGKILVRIRHLNYQPHYGDRICLRGKLREPPGERNPGEFNYKKFLMAHDIYGIVNVRRPENFLLVDSLSGHSPGSVIFKVKKKLFDSLNRLYHGKSRALMQALILGQRGEISPELRESFAKTGVIHALAISGLHVGFVIVIFFAIFGMLRVPHEAKIVLVLLSLLGYNLLIGFKPPIVRASLMATIFLLGRLFQKPTDILNIISMAALIILLINPQQLFQASFQLSFGAILSLVFIYKKLTEFLDKSQWLKTVMQLQLGKYLITLFLVSLAAQLGTLPIVAYYFNRIPIISLLANIVVIPIVGIVIAYGFASLIFSFISIQVAQLFANTNTLCLKCLIFIIEKASQIKISSYEMAAIGLSTVLVYYFILWAVLNLNKKYVRKYAIISLLIMANFLVWKSIFYSDNWLQVTFFDVGQGDAALVTFPDGKNMLIDAGPNQTGFDAGKYFLLPYFKRKGIDKINTVVLSHADNDHIGGLPIIFRNLRIDRVLDAGLYQSSAICSYYQFLIDSLQLSHQIVEGGSRIMNGENYEAFVLHPVSQYKQHQQQDINNNSVVMKIVCGDISFLFTGDIEKEAEKIIAQYGDLIQADVMKIAHHGSNTSSMFELLQLVKPRFAVISVGRDNKFKFPSPLVLQRLKELNISVIRTDENGAIVFRTNGHILQQIR